MAMRYSRTSRASLIHLGIDGASERMMTRSSRMACSARGEKHGLGELADGGIPGGMFGFVVAAHR